MKRFSKSLAAKEKDNTKIKQLFEDLLAILQTFAVSKRNARRCCKNVDELKNNFVLLTLTHERANVVTPVDTYMHQFGENIGCRLEDLGS